MSFESCTSRNGHLEIFSRPHVIKKKQCLLLRTDILQKTVIGCPCGVLGSMFGTVPAAGYMALANTINIRRNTGDLIISFQYSLENERKVFT